MLENGVSRALVTEFIHQSLTENIGDIDKRKIRKIVDSGMSIHEATGQFKDIIDEIENDPLDEIDSGKEYLDEIPDEDDEDDEDDDDDEEEIDEVNPETEEIIGEIMDIVTEGDSNELMTIVRMLGIDANPDRIDSDEEGVIDEIESTLKSMSLEELEEIKETLQEEGVL